MRKLHYVCADEAGLYPFSGENFLYNSIPYLQLKAAKFGSSLTFYAFHRNTAVAQIHFFLLKQNDDNYQAVSIPESPFGSLEFGEVNYNEMKSFIDFILEELRSKKVKQIVIKDCIAAYRKQKCISVESLFLESGFTQQGSLPNHHIEVDTDNMMPKLSSSKRRRVRLSKSAGFETKQLNLSGFTDLYSFIAQSYAAKGRRLSLERPQLEEQLKLFPERWFLFATYDGQKMIAACIAVLVNTGVLYTLYYAASADYDYYSPTICLLASVYRFCFTKDIRIMDFGTSNSDSVAHFKKHMGGQHSQKHTYHLKLQ